MRIVAIREKTVPLGVAIGNADIRFDTMTASVVAVITDRQRHGRPIVGYAFDSIGRYGHGALLLARFAPRVLAAAPRDYLDDAIDLLDPFKTWAIAMRNEKLGGHAERAGAVGLLDAAIWDAAAKAEDKPLRRVLAGRFNGGRSEARIPVYASGGHYRDGDELPALRRELAGYHECGSRRVKIKIGAGTLDRDLRRIETALEIAGGAGNLAVDGNGTFDLATARSYAKRLGPIGLAWMEEPLDPLDYESHRALAADCPVPLATGENIFSAADSRNLLRHGGLLAARVYLQMDISLSYGIVEYLEILALAERHGWSRRRFLPHAGHLFSFHAVAGLGLAGHEAAPDDSALFGGYPEGVKVEDGYVRPWDMPGVGFEAKPNLFALMRELAQ